MIFKLDCPKFLTSVLGVKRPYSLFLLGFGNSHRGGTNRGWTTAWLQGSRSVVIWQDTLEGSPPPTIRTSTPVAATGQVCTKFWTGTPLFLRVQVCLIHFRIFGINQCPILTWGRWHRMLLGRVVQDQQRGKCAGVQPLGSISGQTCQTMPALFVYVAHVLNQARWSQAKTRGHLG